MAGRRNPMNITNTLAFIISIGIGGAAFGMNPLTLKLTQSPRLWRTGQQADEKKQNRIKVLMNQVVTQKNEIIREQKQLVKNKVSNEENGSYLYNFEVGQRDYYVFKLIDRISNKKEKAVLMNCLSQIDDIDFIKLRFQYCNYYWRSPFPVILEVYPKFFSDFLELVDEEAMIYFNEFSYSQITIAKCRFSDINYLIHALVKINPTAVAAHIFELIKRKDSNDINFHEFALLMSLDKTFDKYFAELINEKNIQKDAIQRMIICLMEYDVSWIEHFIPLITKNINVCSKTIKFLLSRDSSLAEYFAKVFNEKNIISDSSDVVGEILKINSSLIQYFSQLINENNIARNQLLVKNLIDKEKLLITYFINLINENNIKDCMGLIFQIIKKYPKLACAIVKNGINANNLFEIPITDLIKIVKDDKQAQEYIKNIEGFDMLCATKDLDNEAIEIMFFDSNNTVLSIQKKQLAKICGILPKESSFLGISKKNGQSWQHFIKNYADVIEEYAKDLQDKQLCQALFRMLNREWREQEKGRYVLYHAQGMNIAFSNMIYTRLLELYYERPIDKESFFAQRCKIPGSHFRYKKLQDFVKNGETIPSFDKGPNYPYCQFTNDSIFGNLHSGLDCSFFWFLRNNNYLINRVDDIIGTPNQHFNHFLLGKYYKKYEHVFDKLKELVDQCKHGIMLMYSFTPEALNTFVFPTTCAYGYKTEVTINGKDAKYWSAQQFMDTVRNNQDHFEGDGSDMHQYVIVMADDHPTDTEKLGSCNPFNPDMRCYHIGADPQVPLIEKILDKLFEKIKQDIQKDGTFFLAECGISTIKSKL